MWIITMFDLPTITKMDKKRYLDFRKLLESEGFSMMQFSVYKKYCETSDIMMASRARVKRLVPEKGEVRILVVTDVQFKKMDIYFGKIKQSPDKGPTQFSLF